MKRLLSIITVIFVIWVTAASCLAKDVEDRKDPFGPLEKKGNPKTLEVEAKDDTFSIIEPEDPIATEVFNLNFANAKDLEITISKLVSHDGRVGIDNRLNSIVVTDTTSNLEQLRLAISRLDTKAPQVMIEVLIATVKLTDELKMGVDWTQLGTSKNFLTQGLNITESINPFGKVTFSSTPGNWNFKGLIDFVETNKDVRILANPKVLVLNNHTATIKTVKEIPYRELTETAEAGSIGTTSFKEAGVKLEVTPQITEDGFIIMDIWPEQSAQVDTFTINNSDVPVIETRNTITTLRVKNGQTIIIGGLRESHSSVQESKIPILGDIPIIGMLFRKVYTEVVESELGVFITPHIYTDDKLSEEELELLEKSQSGKSLYEASDLLRLKSDK